MMMVVVVVIVGGERSSKDARTSEQVSIACSVSRFLQEKIKERTHTHTYAQRGKRARQKEERNMTKKQKGFFFGC